MYYLINTSENTRFLTEIYGACYSANYTNVYLSIDIDKCEWCYNTTSISIQDVLTLDILKQNIRNKKLKDLLNGN